MTRRWKIRAETASTFPPAGLFTKDAATIARVMATKRVSPKGLGSAIRMVQYLLNRAGAKLPARRRRELERAKRILQARRARQLSPSARSGPRGSARPSG
jgi:tRNA(adenine34) deaminase